MKICIWQKIIDRPWGGSNSFLKALARQLLSQGHEVIYQPKSQVNIVLINSWTLGRGKYLSFEKVSKVQKYGRLFLLDEIIPSEKYFFRKMRAVPIVHRLDGIASLYGRHDRADEIQIEINQLTDYTIYQSEFCKNSFSTFNVNPRKSTIIHNGVDNKIYFPSKQIKTLGKTIKAVAVSWSNNPKKGFLKLNEFASCPNIELSFVGNWCRSIMPARGVTLLGIKTADEIANIMRQKDILIHAAENDPCPNVVVEALASGLPILYKNSGGTPELAKGFGVPFTDDIRKSIDEIRYKYVELRNTIMKNLYTFSIESAANKYVEVFNELLNEKKNE